MDEPIKNIDSSLLEAAALPSNLGEAIAAFNASEFAKEVFGSLHGRYLDAKRQEWAEYQGKVHNWEITKYFNLY